MTLPHFAAIAALHEGRVAAPVEQQDGLLTACETGTDRIDEPRTQYDLSRSRSRYRSRSRRRLLPPQVNDFNRWQRPPFDAFRQFEQSVLAVLSIVPGLERRRRAAEYAHCAGRGCADNCKLARMVARRLRLLVAGLVLLVENDRAQLTDGREDCRACANRDAPLARAQRAPRVEALAFRQRRMQHGDDIAEVRTKACDGLRRQRNLGHQYDCAASLALHHFLQQLDVDQCLARAGHAAQQKRPHGLLAVARRG
jgi:hypothetical protein